MRASAVALLGKLAQGVDMPQILTAIGIHDNGGLERRWIGVIPKEKLLSVTAE
jgi:hypothetical protein